MLTFHKYFSGILLRQLINVPVSIRAFFFFELRKQTGSRAAKLPEHRVASTPEKITGRGDAS